MSFFDDVRRGFSAAANRKAYEFIPLGVQGRPQYPDTDIEALQNAYARNELVFAAIGIKAAASIGVRLIVETRSSPKAEWEEEPGHPFRSLMMDPNPEMLESDLMRAEKVSMDTAGIFYAEKVFDGTPGRGGIVKELHPLNPAFLAPVPRPDGKRDYEYKEGQHKEIIPYERMLVKRNYDPRNRWHGLSPLAVAMGSVDADNAQTDFVRAFFNNAGVPSGILKVAGRINQDKADELRQKWASRLGRLSGRQHDITVLDESAEYQKIGTGVAELQSKELRMFFGSRMAMVFGVPPLIIYDYAGLENSSYANLRDAWRNFWSSNLHPTYTEMAAFYTKRLLSDFEPVERIKAELVRLRYDTSGVEWLRESEEEKQARAERSLSAGAITLNEFRAVIGEQSDPAGDYYLRLFNRIPVPRGQVLTGVEVFETDDTGTNTDEAAKARTMAVELKRKADGRRIIEARIERDMEKMFGAWYERVASAVA